MNALLTPEQARQRMCPFSAGRATAPFHCRTNNCLAWSTVWWSGLIPPDQIGKVGFCSRLARGDNAPHFTEQQCAEGAKYQREHPPKPVAWGNHLFAPKK